MQFIVMLNMTKSGAGAGGRRATTKAPGIQGRESSLTARRVKV